MRALHVSQFGRDIESSVVVTGGHVALREKPDNKSAAVDHLSYTIVELQDVYTPYYRYKDDWVYLQTPAGKRGYVNNQYLSGPFDYRACFAKLNGKWLMTVFLEGD